MKKYKKCHKSVKKHFFNNIIKICQYFFNLL